MILSYLCLVVLSTCPQVTEMYSSGGELHLELLNGQPQGSKTLWVGDNIVLVASYPDSFGWSAWVLGYKT